jgi:hypothetical protein
MKHILPLRLPGKAPIFRIAQKTGSNPLHRLANSKKAIKTAMPTPRKMSGHISWPARRRPTSSATAKGANRKRKRQVGKISRRLGSSLLATSMSTTRQRTPAELTIMKLLRNSLPVPSSDNRQFHAIHINPNPMEDPTICNIPARGWGNGFGVSASPPLMKHILPARTSG